ncbi:MAG: T9SS type A sorting domain-containing protein [Bacteroidales bacterium]|jgi:hypothetical protein
MKKIILTLALIIIAIFCNAQEIEYLQLNNKSTNTTIAECDSVSNIQYYQKGDKINLSWDVPGQVSLSHSGEYDNNAIGAGIDFTVGHKFEPEDLIDYVGYSVVKISFVPNESFHCNYTVKVWKKTNGVLEVVASQPVEHFIIEQYNTFTLIDPVVIEENSTYYFGYRAQSGGGFPVGVDAGPAVVGKGDLMLEGNNWISIYELAGADFNFNVCVKAHIVPGLCDSIPTGFNVLRNDTLLKYTPISAYTDENIYFGQQEYCIEAVYNNCTSEKNCILVDVGYSSVSTQKSDFSIYPNPANNYLNISGGNFDMVKIYNSIGKLMGVYDNTNTIDISKYPSGLYIVELIYGSKIFREKIIKK